MALLPNIPSSFVPHEKSIVRSKVSESGLGNIFGFLSYTVLGIVFVIAIGLFFYGRVLASDKVAKNTELAKVEASIDPATVNSFVHLRERLDSSRELLANHIALSGFLSTIQSLLPSTTRFSSLHILVSSSGDARVEGSGVAKSFNALAATSASFGADGRIKDAIFSKMAVHNNNSVSFGFSATLNPKIIMFSPSTYKSEVPIQASTTQQVSTTSSSL